MYPPSEIEDAVISGLPAAVFRLHGRVEAGSLAQARALLADLPLGTSVVIDLTAVTSVDPPGLGCIIGAVRRVREAGGEVTIDGAPPFAARLLHSMGVDRVAAISPSE